MTKMDVNFDNDTVWLSQAQIGELFQRERSVITKHIKNVFEEYEVEQAYMESIKTLTAKTSKKKGGKQ